jgi:gas vesicle protein
MSADIGDRGDHTFLLGLFAGACVGAGLTLWLAPRVMNEIRERVIDSANDLNDRATDRYQQATTRVADAVDEVTKKVQGVRDDMADTVIRGAQQVERIATAAKA